MKITVERGDRLEVVIRDGNKQIGPFQFHFDSLASSATLQPAEHTGRRTHPMKGRKVSPEARRNMKTAQQRRWEKIRGKTLDEDAAKEPAQPTEPAAPEAPAKPKPDRSAIARKAMTPEVRRKISETIKARKAATRR